jgi:WNK lysine deficient protein kinase
MSADNHKNLVIDTSPKGRYLCFNDILGRGAYKIVYRGYDKQNGIEVAWNTVSMIGLCEGEQNSIIKEINLLKELSPQSPNIINFHNAWMNVEKCTIVIITEIALSGTLYDYIKRIGTINMRVIKKWCIQILKGLDIMHEQHVAHRDLKCNNIFISSNTGTVYIGDFGLANRSHTNFHSVIGTPEYMAPEMYEEKYDEKVDIYAFGMCILEMITKEIPYYECTAFGQIWRKVSNGVLPLSVDKIKNLGAKMIIMMCINKDPRKRPSAVELLQDDFFTIITDNDDDENLIIKKKDKNKHNEDKLTMNTEEEIEKDGSPANTLSNTSDTSSNSNNTSSNSNNTLSNSNNTSSNSNNTLSNSNNTSSNLSNALPTTQNNTSQNTQPALNVELYLNNGVDNNGDNTNNDDTGNNTNNEDTDDNANENNKKNDSNKKSNKSAHCTSQTKKNRKNKRLDQNSSLT